MADPPCARRDLQTLVIDEDPTTANALATLLALEPGCIVACQSAVIAARATDLRDFDLIVLGLHLASARNARELAVVDFVFRHNPSATVVIATTKACPRLKALAKRRGVCAVLSKHLLEQELSPLCAWLGVGLRTRRPEALGFDEEEILAQQGEV